MELAYSFPMHGEFTSYNASWNHTKANPTAVGWQKGQTVWMNSALKNKNQWINHQKYRIRFRDAQDTLLNIKMTSVCPWGFSRIRTEIREQGSKRTVLETSPGERRAVLQSSGSRLSVLNVVAWECESLESRFIFAHWEAACRKCKRSLRNFKSIEIKWQCLPNFPADKFFLFIWNWWKSRMSRETYKAEWKYIFLKKQKKIHEKDFLSYSHGQTFLNHWKFHINYILSINAISLKWMSTAALKYYKL